MDSEIMFIDVQNLRPGMVLAENIYDLDGNILLAAGIKLRDNYILKICETPVIRVAVYGGSHVAEVFGAPNRKPSGSAAEKKQQRIEATRYEARTSLQTGISQLTSLEIANASIILEVVEKILNDILASDDIVFHIDQLRDLDAYLLDHSINVAILSVVMGIVSGFTRAELQKLAVGAILHDVGKLFLDQDLVNRPGPLTAEEFSLIKYHSKLGSDLLKKFPEIDRESVEIALYHHERLDGSGYPSGLMGQEIAIFAQIVGIIDVFDALTSDKVYAKKVSPYKAMQIIFKDIDVKFDKVLLTRFLTSVGYYYHGAVVRLFNESIGVVTERDRYRPVVRVIQDGSGKVVADHYEIDLKKNPTIRIKAILSEAESAILPYFTNKNMGIS